MDSSQLQRQTRAASRQLLEETGPFFFFAYCTFVWCRIVLNIKEEEEYRLEWNIKLEKVCSDLAIVAVSSQIHLHRFLVGGLCNLLLDTKIVSTAECISHAVIVLYWYNSLVAHTITGALSTPVIPLWV